MAPTSSQLHATMAKLRPAINEDSMKVGDVIERLMEFKKFNYLGCNI
jgi:hypothetical protein